MKKSTRRRLLVSSLAMLLVAIVAMGTATFAWFSTKTSATAEVLKANTTQGTNLQISEQKDTGWTQQLIFTNKETKKLDPVTTDDLTTWYAATADGWDSVVASATPTAVGKDDYVLEQPIYVQYAADKGSFALNVDLKVHVELGTDDYYRVAIVPMTDDVSVATGAETYIYADANNIVQGATYAKYASNTNTTDIPLGTINAGEVYGYNVLIWFEGEDLDCKDSLSKNDVHLSFEFGGTAA